MDPEELKQFREEFSSIDPKNLEEVKEWILQYPEFTVAELCQVMNKSLTYVMILKQKIGISRVYMIETMGGTLVSRKRREKIRIRRLTPNEIKEMYTSGLGIQTLARITDRSRNYIRTKLHQLGVPVRPVEHNPCCCKEWLIEHYINRKQSLTACAKLAGVSRFIMRQWLAKFDIQLRDQFETSYAILDQKTGKFPTASACSTQSTATV